jgi:hypothetical protein
MILSIVLLYTPAISSRFLPNIVLRALFSKSTFPPLIRGQVLKSCKTTGKIIDLHILSFRNFGKMQEDNVF